MLTLCINTAGHLNTLALVKNGELLEEKSWQSNRDETETLLPNLENLIQAQNLHFDDLEALHVISGVGGFTSLRVGISIVNTIAYVQKIPIFESSVFELWQKRLKTEEEVATLLDAGRQECFYFPNKKVTHEEDFFFLLSPKEKTKKDEEQGGIKIIPNANLSELKEKLWIGEMNDRQRKMLAPRKALIDLKSPGEAFAEIKLKNKKPHQLIEPWYGREPNISVAKALF